MLRAHLLLVLLNGRAGIPLFYRGVLLTRGILFPFPSKKPLELKNLSREPCGKQRKAIQVNHGVCYAQADADADAAHARSFLLEIAAHH